MDEREHWMPLRDILSTIGSECCELGECVDRLQHTLSPALVRLGLDERSHQDLQSLDAISQRLAALTAYVRELGKLLPAELNVDVNSAVEMVSLSELQRRLRGLPAPLGPVHSAGELELF